MQAQDASGETPRPRNTEDLSVELVQRDRRYPLERAAVLIDVDGRDVLVRASRYRRGRWTTAVLDGRFEPGESTGDDDLDAQCVRLALRAFASGRRRTT
jgi:hypothetical protein